MMPSRQARQANQTTVSKKLLLFDIDGTLIVSGGAGEKALHRALLRAFGTDRGMDQVVFAGATDSGIARQLLLANALEPSPENILRLLDTYVEILEQELPRHQGRLLAGIAGLLESLHQRGDCQLALLTGNIERGAKLKLKHYGVWRYFAFGAFADDSHDRNELGHFARQRALAHTGWDFNPESIYVLGDTPKDIACGRAIQAKTVAIATGNYSLAELAEHKPDFLFADLTDHEAVIKALFS